LELKTLVPKSVIEAEGNTNNGNVLMMFLDRSGSMSGNNWDNLAESVR